MILLLLLIVWHLLLSLQKQMKQANIIRCLKVKAIMVYMIMKSSFGL